MHHNDTYYLCSVLVWLEWHRCRMAPLRRIRQDQGSTNWFRPVWVNGMNKSPAS